MRSTQTRGQKLRARFVEPSRGITFEMRADEQYLRILPSHILTDFVRELAEALALVMKGTSATAGAWCEDDTYRLVFTRRDGLVSLQVKEYPSWAAYRRDSSSEFRTVFSIEGSIDDICLPLWRSLRALEGTLSLEDYAKVARHPFPLSTVASITELAHGRAGKQSGAS